MDALQSRLLNLVAAIVKRDEEFYVPVKKLWIYLCKDGDYPSLSLEEFTDILEQDPRFEFVRGIELTEGLGELTSEEREEVEAEMERFGLYGGLRVGLKTRRPSKEDLIHIMEKKITNIFDALKQAWELRPSDNPQVEDQLLGALAMTQKLQQEIKKAFENSAEKGKKKNG
ncbi:MAG: hypothetical protein DRQ02_02580 [Candidatus Latescibacterota bacterium]|nr:MAG: hypothetical protein DRQ02_02580 [Candidatus Latescibacterota bacterium]RKY72917.1 MAG: hypothetical protein DRQ24_03855 [Candidatus Latescibacterota bacterium]HDN67761.1 hypothetical protein [Bacillota bacterium]